MTTKTKPSNKPERDKAHLNRTVLLHFVQTGESLTKDQLAAKLGWSPEGVHRSLPKDKRGNADVDVIDGWGAYAPTKDALRAALQDTAELVEDLAAYANGLPYGFDDKEGEAILARTSETAPFRRCASAKEPA